MAPPSSDPTRAPTPSRTEYQPEGAQFIIVSDSAATYDWYAAKDDCMLHYGSSLASLHSVSEEDDLGAQCSDAFPVDGCNTWFGLTDFGVKGNWSYPDGSRYDYQVTWHPGLYCTKHMAHVLGTMRCSICSTCLAVRSAGVWAEAFKQRPEYLLSSS